MATTQHVMIVGVFASGTQAEQAKEQLLNAGCSQEQIKTSMEDLTPGKAVSTSTAPQNEMVRDGAIGGGAGALLGTGAGFLARRMISTLANQPLWLILLAGAAIGSLLGSIPGLLIGKRMSSNQAQQDEASPRRVLISIQTDNPQDILDTLRSNGAYEVHTTPLPGSQQSQTSSSVSQAPAQTAPTNETPATSGAVFGGVQNPPYASALEAKQEPSLVVGAFPNQGTADTAIDALLEAGFTSDQIRYSEHGAGGGGILRHLISLGVPSATAQAYEQEFETGHTIVTVKTTDRLQEAQYLMEHHGGYNIRQFSSQPASPTAPALEAMQDIKLREERLRVNKQQVQTGEVTIHKELVTEEKTITVPITREEMVIEYHSVAEEGETAAAINPEGETIRIPISEEQVHITKEMVQTSEVSISRQEVQEVQHITETVKREELQVESQGDVKIKDIITDNTTDQASTEQS